MGREKHKAFGHSKRANIERRTYEEKEKEHEPSFRRRLEEHEEKNKWMQHATKHPGKTRAYMAREYGSRAFNENGTIKESMLDKAIREAKKRGDTERERELVLARTYKQRGRRKLVEV